MVYSSVKFDVLLYSIPLGAFISGVIALYQYYILNLESAFYSQMKIQSGDMAMSLGLFSFVIAFHLLDINKKNVISFVGAGGKTTLIYNMAEELMKLGKNVIITTTTNMFISQKYFLYSSDLVEIKKYLNKSKIVIKNLTNKKNIVDFFKTNRIEVIIVLIVTLLVSLTFYLSYAYFTGSASSSIIKGLVGSISNADIKINVFTKL